MSFFKRISATVTANIDRAISQIENHDAVVEAALEEVRDATARLKVQLARVKAETRRLETQAGELADEEAKWTERARRVATEDETRALTCLQRRKDCRGRAERVAAMLTKQRELEHKLETDLKRLRTRLDDIHHRRQELRSRELSAKGTRINAELDRRQGMDVEQIFERWEVDVTRSEVSAEVLDEADDIAVDLAVDDFEKEERDAELRAELEALVSAKEEDR